MTSPILLSLQVSAAALILDILVGTLIVYILHRWRVPGEAVIHTICTLPLVLPPVVTGFFLLLLCNPTYLPGAILKELGLSPLFTPYGAALAAAVIAFPLYYQTLRTAIESVDTAAQDAARLLGAGEWTVFRRITLPMAKKGICTAVILSFTRALGEFGATMLIAGNIPGYTQTMPLAIYFSVEQGDYGTALTYVLWIIAITFCLLYTIRNSKKLA